jgi:hypothetical protein
MTAAFIFLSIATTLARVGIIHFGGRSVGVAEAKPGTV